MRAIRRRYGRAKAVDRARAAYVAFCNEIGSDAVSEENAILSIGRDYLPACEWHGGRW